MHSFLMTWLALLAVDIAVVIVPGPNFFMAVRNTTLYGRRAGVFTALGFGLGIGVHAALCILGVGALIAYSELWFDVIKYAGAAYLIYLGIRALVEKKQVRDPLAEPLPEGKVVLSASGSFVSGLVTTLLNPKAILFFVALFTQFINASMPLWQQALLGLTCAVIESLWFTLVAYVLTTPRVEKAFLKASNAINRVCGALFIMLGIRLVFTRMV